MFELSVPPWIKASLLYSDTDIQYTWLAYLDWVYTSLIDVHSVIDRNQRQNRFQVVYCKGDIFVVKKKKKKLNT